MNPHVSLFLLLVVILGACLIAIGAVAAGFLAWVMGADVIEWMWRGGFVLPTAATMAGFAEVLVAE